MPNVPLQYDVFVSYSSEDQDWVLNSLFKTMTSNRYEVCIDFKDFIPGESLYIQQNFNGLNTCGIMKICSRGSLS